MSRVQHDMPACSVFNRYDNLLTSTLARNNILVLMRFVYVSACSVTVEDNGERLKLKGIDNNFCHDNGKIEAIV